MVLSTLPPLPLRTLKPRTQQEQRVPKGRRRRKKKDKATVEAATTVTAGAMTAEAATNYNRKKDTVGGGTACEDRIPRFMPTDRCIVELPVEDEEEL